LGRCLFNFWWLGIFGDFAFSGLNRFGGGLGETIAGPRIGFLSDLKDLVIGNIAQAIDEDQDTNFARELIDFAGRYGPFASTFYLRLPLQRLVLDQMQMMVDPNAEKRFRRSESKLYSETGQRPWWSSGRMEPQRAPDIGAAFGQ
jgi:hypothetical protein